MLLMPQTDWQWIYNDAYGVLSVSLGLEMEFLTPYKTKLLIPDALETMEFSVEHAKFYVDMLDRMQKRLNITDAAAVQIALNATAAYFLLKPQMPKSWYFEASDVCVFADVGKVFELRCQGERHMVMIVENGLQAAMVMVLGKQCELGDGKVLAQFDIIKVMHNRLHELTRHRQIVAA